LWKFNDLFNDVVARYLYLMPNYMEIGEPSPGRLATALELILEGRSVGFGDFSLCVLNGILLICPYYPASAMRNDDLAAETMRTATLQVDALMAEEGSYHRALAGLPRRIELVVDFGKSEVKVAEFKDGNVHWS
jgi:hypothetical protein